MTKKFPALVLILALLLSGCTLARTDTAEETGTDPTDKLIGAFITTEPLDLFDFESYLNDHLSKVLEGGAIEGDTSAYENRIYAVQTEQNGHVDFAFEGLEGYAMFTPTIPQSDPLETYVTTCMDSGINEIKTAVHSIDDNIREQSLEGTMYLAADAGVVTFYLNPVYQDEEGRVYLVSGQGLSFNCTVGGSSTMTTDNEVTTTVDGQETIQRGSVKVTFEVVPRPEEIVVLQLDADSNVLSRKTYAPGTLPQQITPMDGTDYFLVETHNGHGVTRKLVEKGTQYMTTFLPLENGILDSMSTEILWEA